MTVVHFGIPEDRWQPLSVDEVVQLMTDAPFTWSLAGGYAIEQFTGAAFRDHEDIDIMVFRDEQLALQRWLATNWSLYASDPPGTLRRWLPDEYLGAGINDLWAHRHGADAWQLQAIIVDVEGDEWISRRGPMVRGPRHSLLTCYAGVPCVRAEVQLMYKARHRRPKDEQDFLACLPRLERPAKDWLGDQIRLLHGADHPWLAALI